MKKNSLDLSGKIEDLTIELYEAIDQITSELGIKYLVVGATARDLVLHYGYGARIKRATSDVDFGMLVESWEVYEKLKQKLIENYFEATEVEHRFIDINDTKVDIVPFGHLEDGSSNIHWPPKGETIMNVLGFKEALDNAIKIKIGNGSILELPVASPEGLALLKIISWNDRDKSIRDRDAKDFAYLLENYEIVDTVSERIYEHDFIVEYGWSVEKGSAHLLGMESSAIAMKGTKKKIKEILNSNMDSSGPNHLVEEMCVNIDNEYSGKLELVQAFSNGFNS